MRICFISTSFDENRGGGGVFAHLFRRMSSRHEIIVVSRTANEDPAWQSVEVPTRSSHSYFWFTEYQFSKEAVTRVRELHAARPFDLILINQVIGSSLVQLTSLGIPVVYVIHHPVSVDISLALEESKNALERLSWRLAYGPLALIQRRLVRAFKTVLTVSESARERIAADYRISPQDITVIHNGIDTDFFRRTRQSESHTVLAVGSYQHPRRGFPYLLQAYQQLSEAGFVILDVGRRTDQQDALIKAIPRVTTFELVEREQLPDLYSRASVVISTSLYEGFGLSIAEALSCERPCVAFAAGGVNDLLGRVDPQLLSPVRDVAALVAKVKAVSGSLEGSRYREAVIRHFSLSRMTEAYELFFQRLITAQ